MVDDGKKPTGGASGSNSNIIAIDMNDPLYLHSNDTNGTPLERCNSIVLTWILNCVSADLFVGQVFSSNAKTMWDELAKTYDKLNSLWREYDAMVQLPICTCDGASSYKDHAQLLKLMQIIMGLDDVYGPIRSAILTTHPLLTVKEAFSLFSREESHRLSHLGGSGVKGNNIAFVARPSGDSRVSSPSIVPRSGDNRRRLNNSNARNTNLVYKNSNMTGHTIKRCFELVGYPTNFKKRAVTSQNVTSNVPANVAVSNAFGTSSKMIRNVKFYETVYPFKNDSLTKDFIIEEKGLNSLNFFDNQWPSEPNDDERGLNDSDGTNSPPVVLAEDTANAGSSSVDLSTSTSSKATSHPEP
ncbi:hypothetical protein Tco_1223783, partial [Tanacetum coccineum]